VYVPGELEALKRARYEREGIPLNPVTLRGVADAARELGVDTGRYRWLESSGGRRVRNEE
jgi:LDH2 family malate/lactate/ureidoglycolate dehydrogenase